MEAEHTVAERRLTGWIVVGLEAPVITSASMKQGAAATFKGTLSFHPQDGDVQAAYRAGS
ncbi:hypothetical protein [Streptomyces sp. NPDC001250]|uniref:hypothetical protein n=1 Tax=unclassified Streptomyces TaxID=2593676 RepID=UPI00331C52CE